jgi:hypothetical protein
MKELIIDRAIWARGDVFAKEQVAAGAPCAGNWLLDVAGKMCCIGIYLKSCGLPEERLKKVGEPVDVLNQATIDGAEVELPKEALWLLETTHGSEDEPSHTNSDTASALMAENDSDEVSEEDREKVIASIFAKVDIEVKFVGETPRPAEETTDGKG